MAVKTEFHRTIKGLKYKHDLEQFLSDLIR